MRDTWFADNRDLVKWGTLAHIAARENLNLIVQIPYFRTGDRPPLNSQNAPVSIHSTVWDFFRNVTAVERLGQQLEREIIVMADPFNPPSVQSIAN